MEITIDKYFFEKTILTSTSATADVFYSLSDQIETATQDATIFFFPVETKSEDLSEELLTEVKRYICFKAFYNAIPLLDLVLTPTGFGVVSNQNLAPASRDRVESLRRLVGNCRDESIDRVLEMLPLLKDWGDTIVARFRIGSLFYTAHQLRDYAGKPEALRSDLHQLGPTIAEAEEIIQSHISKELFKSLLEKIRKNTLADDEIIVLHALRRAVGFFINDKLPAFRREIDDVVNVLEDNPVKFPIYKDSTAYKVKHFEHYQNDKDDTAYFFG